MTTSTQYNSNGRILFEGASKIDGAPIVVIATGFTTKSANSKTADLIQTHILRADMMPMEAVHTGEDVSICGQCKHRGEQQNGKGRSCYVKVFQAPTGIFKAYKRGRYQHASAEEISELCKGRKIRFGAYGDPAAVPTHIWAAMAKRADSWNGYTHQWADNYCDDNLQRYCMASVDSADEKAQALALGWRTFRVRTDGEAKLKGEGVCPASAESGHALQCDECMQCDGMRRAGARRLNDGIVITIHGTAGNVNTFTRGAS